MIFFGLKLRLMRSMQKAYPAYQIGSLTMMTGTIRRAVTRRGRPTCRKHPEEPENHFCTDCRVNVCLKCAVRKHVRKKHKIITQSEHLMGQVGQEQLEMIDSRSAEDMKEVVFEKYDEFLDKMRLHLNRLLDKRVADIESVFDESIRQLVQRKEKVIVEVRKLFGELETELADIRRTSRDHSGRLQNLRERAPSMTRDKLLQELEDVLELTTDLDCGTRLMQSSRRGESMALEARLGTGESLNPYNASTKDCGDGWTAVCVELSRGMTGMAATPGGLMAIASKKGGIAIYSPTGRLQERVFPGVRVRRLDFLSDGRLVIRSTKNRITLYTRDFQRELSVRFETLQEEDVDHGGLTVDDDDNIYVSYRKAKRIQIFAPTGGMVVREISCDGFEPWQIFTVKASKHLLVSSVYRVVSRIDDTGIVRNLLEAPSAYTYALPCACSDGSILIGWLKYKEGLLSISRYTRELTHVETLITDSQIQKPATSRRNWYYLQSFSSGEMAFSTPEMLYIYRKTASCRNMLETTMCAPTLTLVSDA